MRIHITNPNSSFAMTRTIARAAARAAGPGVEIAASTNTAGPASIEGHRDGVLAVPGLLERIKEAERGQGVAAHVIACFDDTGLDAARSVAAAPVVGIGEAACLLAAQLAETFVVVTAAAVSIPVLEVNLRRTGLIARCAGVRAAEVAVLDIEGDGAATVAQALRRAAREVPGAALVLGCAGMAEMAEQIARELNRPVIDGVAAAIVLAEGLGRLGHRTTRYGGYAALSRNL